MGQFRLDCFFFFDKYHIALVFERFLYQIFQLSSLDLLDPFQDLGNSSVVAGLFVCSNYVLSCVRRKTM